MLEVKKVQVNKIQNNIVKWADIVLAVFAANLVDFERKSRVKWTAAYCTVLFLPSVFLNSGVWGQCDAIYVSALLAFLYYAMRGNSGKAVLAYSISFVFKLQAVFFAPLLLLLLLQALLCLHRLIDIILIALTLLDLSDRCRLRV